MILLNYRLISIKFNNLILWKLCHLILMGKLMKPLKLCKKNKNFSKKKDNKKLKKQKRKLPKNKKSKKIKMKINKKIKRNKENQLQKRNKLIWTMLKNSQNFDKFNFIVYYDRLNLFNFYIFFKLILFLKYV